MIKYRRINVPIYAHKFTKTGYAKAFGKMQPPARLGLHSRPRRQADASVAKPYQEKCIQIEGWDGGEQFGHNAK